MENKSHALAAGIFVVIVAALVAGLALWLTRDNANYQLYELTSRDSVSGLQPQAAVRYKGVAVGKVLRIGFDPDVSGNVLIRIAVNEQAPISPTTYASLGYQGVTGLAHVLLDDGDKPYPVQPAGESGLPRLLLKPSPFGQLAEQAPAILEQVENATHRLNQLLSDDNQAKVSAALGNIGQAAADLSTLAHTVDASVKTRLNPALEAVPPLANEARNTLRAVQKTADQTSAVVADAGRVVQSIAQPGGVMDQITHGTQSLARASDMLTGNTLPRVNRVVDEARVAVRQMGRLAGDASDSPQIFIYGHGAIPPGPGEVGFTAPAAIAP